MATFYAPQSQGFQGLNIGEILARGQRYRAGEQAMRRSQAEEDQAAQLRPLETLGRQLALRGQLLGSVETPEDYAAILPTIQAAGLPMADLPEDRRSTASQTFRRPEVPATSQSRAAWMPDFGAPMAPAALPSGELSAQGIAPEDVPTIQRRAQAGLPLNVQQKFQDAEIGRILQRERMATDRAKYDEQGRYRETMADLAERRFGLSEKTAEASANTDRQRIAMERERLRLAKEAADRDAKSAGAGGKFTGDQTNAATFGRRLEQAIPYLEQAYTQFDPTTMQGSLQVEAARKGGLASLASNPAAKAAVTAELNILAAILRKESGAAISESEYASAGKIYFPRYGDTPEIRAQKMGTMRQALAGLKTAAGPAWEATPLVGNGPSAAPAKPAATSDAPPVSVLREGVGKKFPNGQVWTLRNGQAVRVQ